MTAKGRTAARPRAAANGHSTNGTGPKVLRLTTTGTYTERREPLFCIDDTEYTVWVNPGANLGLKWLDLIKERGTEVAVAWAMQTLLGADAYKALMDYDELTEEHLTQIAEAVRDIMAGSVEGPKAKR